jgi:hypothetical protein
MRPSYEELLAALKVACGYMPEAADAGRADRGEAAARVMAEVAAVDAALAAAAAFLAEAGGDAALSEAAVDFGDLFSKKKFAVRKGHGGGPCSYVTLGPAELAAVAAFGYEQGAKGFGTAPVAFSATGAAAVDRAFAAWRAGQPRPDWVGFADMPAEAVVSAVVEAVATSLSAAGFAAAADALRRGEKKE